LPERSLDLVIGSLGILKAGGAYVPLDPAYPGALGLHDRRFTSASAIDPTETARGLPGTGRMWSGHRLGDCTKHCQENLRQGNG